jgi:hypothetical protein
LATFLQSFAANMQSMSPLGNIVDSKA